MVITTRDYDRARRQRAQGQPPRVFTDREGRERMVPHLWRWESADIYLLRHLMLTRDGIVWQGTEHNVRCRAITRGELADPMLAAGWKQPRWDMPPASGFYQPLVVANA